MQVEFFGACREVTGSCTLVTTAQSRFLIDCGLFQGSEFAEERNLSPFGFDPDSLDFVILTHAHIDHCGRLPKLFKEGFGGKVYCTPATRDLAEVMLLDSAGVIEREAEKKNRQPLYRETDVIDLFSRFVTAGYGESKKINDEVSVIFRDAGHILGAASVELLVTENGVTKKVVFSGDLGNPPAPIVRDTEMIAGADAVIMEATYGNRVHEPSDLRLQLLTQAVEQSVRQGGTLMIPAFALERTQEVLYELNHLVENDIIPKVPIYVDSPLAIKATGVYKKYAHLYDEASRALVESGDDLFNFPGLYYTKTVGESKAINHAPAPKVILAGSGMLLGGRMPHHLVRYLPDPKSHLLIISYQPAGSIGRQLLDGAKTVTIEGEPVHVRASVSAIGSYSSHADQPKLLRWLLAMRSPKPTQLFINHSELPGAQGLVEAIAQKTKLPIVIPEYQHKYEI